MHSYQKKIMNNVYKRSIKMRPFYLMYL